MAPDEQKVGRLPTVRRLPSYLHLLRQLNSKGLEFVSGTFIANELNLEPIQVRKDLEITGITGKPGVGFAVVELIRAIEEFLGWHNNTDTFLVGAGSLGTALLGYEGFKHYGLNIVAVFDSDPVKIGKFIHGHEVFDLGCLGALAERMQVHIGIVTVPAHAAQAVADVLVQADIRGIWNFSPQKLNVPEYVVVQNEDLSAGLAVLSIRMARIGTGKSSTGKEEL
jgi:redox-sensing transcriptional repressor